MDYSKVRRRSTGLDRFPSSSIYSIWNNHVLPATAGKINCAMDARNGRNFYILPRHGQIQKDLSCPPGPIDDTAALAGNIYKHRSRNGHVCKR